MLTDNMDPLAAALLQARAMHFRHALIETAGLFWIAVEMIILYAVLLARRYLAEDSAFAELTLTARERRRAWAWGFLFTALCVFVFARHVPLAPLHRVLEQHGTELPVAAFRECYTRRVHEHLLLWAGFVTAWVVLEAFIVYHGWRSYRLLRGLLSRAEADAPC
ncbi:MAG TPA: hypothetical protein PKI11_07305 [Candidatus Hydrogenedentes bacterium]|nr:hypothetical protein [Candidatus Hydrogenedentota bacterium]